MSSIVVRNLEDVQSKPDGRGVAIDEVGVAGVRLPVRVAGARDEACSTVAEFEMTVSLDAGTKGTHMSRFVEALAAWDRDFDGPALAALAADVRERLASPSARIAMSFPYFLERNAPVTGIPALVEYEGRLAASWGPDATVTVGVRVPVASLCPCSKEISDFGAHNQRGHVDIEVDCVPGAEVALDDLVEMAEEAASAPVYALLKRPDERFVTMQAYENPAFVEDIVRDVVVALRDDDRVHRYTVGVRNLESIHAHDAVAKVRGAR